MVSVFAAVFSRLWNLNAECWEFLVQSNLVPWSPSREEDSGERGKIVSSSLVPPKIKSKMMKMEKMAKCLWWCSPYWHFKGTHFRYGILVKPRFESGQMSIFSANRGSSFLPTRKKMLKRKKRKRTRSSLLLLLVCVRQDRHRLVFASSGCQPISSLICYLYIL